ncbi:MAG: zinc-binding dehydrogenase [Clostridia bacterium]|nr:zinc-binding dehydrogenase [Clostridia bacterium]
MKSYVVYADQHCAIEEMPMPTYGDYDALVKIESCGVCSGTDMKIIHGKFKGVEQYPAVLGHEGVGRVVALGSKVKNFAIGDLVLMPYWSDVPEGYSSAWGTYSEYNIVTDAVAMEKDGLIPDDFAYGQRKLPAEFDPVASAMIITFREVLSTMKRFGLEANKSIAILGLGPVGLSFVQFAKLMGMGPVIAMDIDDAKLEMAKAKGADYVINSKTTDIVKVIREICPDGIDYALDAVGVIPFINQALECIVPDGKICVYGISEQMTANIDWSKCPYNWTLHFHQFPSKKAESEAHDQICAWIKAGILNPMDYISHVFDFADIDKAFDRIKNRESSMKMVIKF